MRKRGMRRIDSISGGVSLTLRHLRGGFERSALVGIAALVGACSASPAEEAVQSSSEAVQPSPVVDVRRSLAITDQPILANFGFQRVMDQLVATSGVSGATATALFQQWWDTQNASGLDADPTGPNCTGSLNGYPYTCRDAPAEGVQAVCNPFSAGSTCAYIPVGLFMRFDLAPEDGSHCGEYRVVFAKETGRLPEGSQNRATLIFEAALQNPHVNQGIRGCQRLVRKFAELSEETDLNERLEILEEIYFDGYAEFEPVIQYANFGDNALGVGQVRTNQFVQPDAPRIWNLREFKLAKQDCSSGCKLRFVPVTNKVNPFGPLFDPALTHANAAGFQSEFLTQVARLAATNANAIGMNTSDVYNSGQSLATSLSTETNYPANFGVTANAFRTAIQTELTTIGSPLTPDDIVKRAQVASCAGCHRLSNNVALGGSITWPPSLGFTHVSERDEDLETLSGVTRFKLSDALVNLLLPHRKQLVEDYLNEVPRPARPPKDPIGGRWVH